MLVNRLAICKTTLQAVIRDAYSSGQLWAAWQAILQLKQEIPLVSGSCTLQPVAFICSALGCSTQIAFQILCQVRFALLQVNLIFASSFVLTVVLLIFWRSFRRQPIYLLDFECYRPSPNLHVPHDKFINRSRETGVSLI